MLFQQAIDLPVVDFGRETGIHHHGIQIEQAEQGLHTRVHVRLARHARTVEHRELLVEQYREAARMIRIREHVPGL